MVLDTPERMKMLKKYGFCTHIANGLSSSMHGHSFLEFTYVEKGNITHTFDDKTEELKEGDYFIVDYGTKHGYKSADGKDISVINLLFYPDFIDRTLSRGDNFEKVVNSYLIRFRYRSLNRSPNGMRFFDNNGEVKSIVNNVITEFESREAGYLECIRCLIAQILIITMRKISKSEVYAKESPIIKEITDDIKNNYREKLLLSDYAKKYNYTISHFSKKFNEEMGVGFTEYLQRIRIEQSCRLLESREKSVSEIAMDVGYTNVKFFNKVFKQLVGITPKQFQKISK